MESTKYVGLDVHKEATTIAVMNSAGKLIMESIIETKAITIRQFIQGLRGDVHVTFEEGTWAAWLYDLLKPYVTKVVVCDPRNPTRKPRYLAAAPEPLASNASVLADTGMRPEKCFRLRWKSVTWLNGRNGALLVTHGKTAAARRVIPMTPRGRLVLEAKWDAAGNQKRACSRDAPKGQRRLLLIQPSHVKFRST